ncbi:uncharacterized protein LOC110721150 [Chenopodium quinoa]|uniref:uncharacterized protein LOC110721150 n=1 Tax=Chenopodium quinoa TaxID=63459 RepID=UPI000B76F427|nr:uncharacterized protein LOC110721150 [Chenopodium quinoa]
MASKMKDLATNFVKLDRFDGGNFRRWQKKVHFLLTTLNVAYVLTQEVPQEVENETVAQSRARLKHENDNFICHGHILNAMEDTLFDTYLHVTSAKELWEMLESRYMKKDVTSNKFIVSQFNSYMMKDNRSVMEQFHEIERLLGHFKQHNMNMDESIVVSSIVDKLPHSWKDFKHSLKHKKEDISLEELANNFRVEEEFRKQEDTKKQHVSSVNVVETRESSKAQSKKIKGKPNKQN